MGMEIDVRSKRKRNSWCVCYITLSKGAEHRKNEAWMSDLHLGLGLLPSYSIDQARFTRDAFPHQISPYIQWHLHLHLHRPLLSLSFFLPVLPTCSLSVTRAALPNLPFASFYLLPLPEASSARKDLKILTYSLPEGFGILGFHLRV